MKYTKVVVELVALGLGHRVFRMEFNGNKGTLQIAVKEFNGFNPDDLPGVKKMGKTFIKNGNINYSLKFNPEILTSDRVKRMLQAPVVR